MFTNSFHANLIPQFGLCDILSLVKIDLEMASTRTVSILINPNCTNPKSHLRKNSNLNWSRKIIPDQQPTKTGFDGISKEDQFARREKGVATHRVQNWETPTLLQCKFRHKFNEVLSHPENFSSEIRFQKGICTEQFIF